jgi:predicted transposase YbfD/YdcC
MSKYENPLHIVSAQIAELGITFGQQAVDGKSNEIPAVRELLEMLKISGCLVVADAMHCQKETAKTIVAGKADYLLSVKDNQSALKKDIKDYVEDSALKKTMGTATKTEKNRERIEKRTAYVTNDISGLYNREEWADLACIGAIYTQFTSEKGSTNEWHYYISSRNLTASELLHHARLEWSVETMHWLLDVHFGEDFCRVEDNNVQQNLNMTRKVAINCVKLFKADTKSKRAISKIMFDCLLDHSHILKIISEN